MIMSYLRELFRIVILLTLLAPAGLQAQTAPKEAPQQVTASDNGVFQAPVIIDGTELFLVRGSTALPGTERAELVSSRIIAAAEANNSSTIAITLRDVDLGVEIHADGHLITVVTNSDAELEQLDIPVLTKLQADAIRKAVLSYRAARTSQARLHSIVVVALWTLGFVIFTTFIFWLRRRLKIMINTLVHRHFASVESATQSHVQADAIAALIRFGVNFVLFAVLFLGIYYYLSLILLSFAETRYVAQLLLTYVTKPVLNILIGFVLYIPNLITLAIIAFLTMYVIKGLRVFFDAV